MLNHNSIKLRKIGSSLKSLEELAEQLVETMSYIEEKELLNDSPYFLLALFSSRGSYPFMAALEHIASQAEIKPHTDFVLLPHIFSLENLFEVVSDFDRLSYDSYSHVVDLMYGDIAKQISERIIDLNDAAGGVPLVVSDWDEVNTGNNRVERMKVYHKFKLPPEVPVYVLSFIGSGGRNLTGRNIKAFGRLTKKKPDNFTYMDFEASSPISWSDDEKFFGDVGFVYPGIAAPSVELVRNIIRKEALPEFYSLFFRNHCKHLAEFLGVHEDIFYKLLPVENDSTLPQINSEEVILSLSYLAYRESIETVAQGNGIKMNSRPLDGRFEVDSDAGAVYKIKRSGFTQKILQRRVGGIPEDFESYRSPFVMFYDLNSRAAPLINSLIERYFRQIKVARAKKSD